MPRRLSLCALLAIAALSIGACRIVTNEELARIQTEQWPPKGPPPVEFPVRHGMTEDEVWRAIVDAKLESSPLSIELITDSRDPDKRWTPLAKLSIPEKGLYYLHFWVETHTGRRQHTVKFYEDRVSSIDVHYSDRSEREPLYCDVCARRLHACRCERR